MNLTKAKETKTRVCCLYRVSTKGQVDKAENDIPMQKKACHEFAESKGRKNRSLISCWSSCSTVWAERITKRRLY